MRQDAEKPRESGPTCCRKAKPYHPWEGKEAGIKPGPLRSYPLSCTAACIQFEAYWRCIFDRMILRAA